MQEARERQRWRFAGTALVMSNADMGPGEVRRHCGADEHHQALLKAAMQQLPARGYHRTQKPARTIADLAGCEAIAAVHAAEALQYRVRKQV